jgi:hypothetical protein
MLLPCKGDFGIFLELVGHQQEILYLAYSKSLKRKGT